MLFTSLEQVLGKARKDEALEYMASHPEDIVPALRWAVTDHPCNGWRAAWLLTHSIEDNDTRLHPFIDAMIARIPETADGHQRELFRLLLRMELNDEQEGTLFNLAVTQWEAVQKKPAVRYFAMKFLLAMAEKYPELRGEVKLLTQPHHLKDLSPGIRTSILRQIRRVLG